MKRTRHKSVHRIGRGALVEGSLRFSGRLEVEGRVNGAIIAEDARGGAVRVASTGHVEGEIEAAVVQVAGTVRGPIRASKRLYVQSGARLDGELLYRDLQLEFGALVTGSLKSYDSDDVGLKLVAIGRK
ncbi:MAG: polymer-forming cytoskeletal protein [Lautropia sp.]|nr:polymer-forming cytoskeletal protein [Lautropia sp.]